MRGWWVLRSRRAVLLTGAAVGFGVIGVSDRPATSLQTDSVDGGRSTNTGPGGDVFDRMRGQWRGLLVAVDYDPADPDLAAVLARIGVDGRRWWWEMDRSAERAFLWSDARLDADLSFAISRSFDRLRSMALAWATPGVDLVGSGDLLADVVSGLDWMVDEYYREDAEIIGNWYEWQVNGPAAFNDAVVLIYDELSPDQIAMYARAVAHFTPAPFGAAANRALTAGVVGGRGVLTRDPAVVTLAVDGLSPVLRYVSSGDGFYRDGSFVQHEFVPYVGAYGVSLLDALVPLFRMVARTPWEVDARIVYEWLRDSFDPVLWRGALADMVSGRSISRWNEHEHYHGHDVLEAALALAESAPPEYRGWVRSMLKEWLLSDTFDEPMSQWKVSGVLAAKELANDESVQRRGELLASKVFARQDRVVHRRPGWMLGISLNSTRTARFESINDENLRAWLTSDGATYLYTGDGGSFTDSFWPTVDPYRIPGTTAEVRTRNAGEGGNVRGGRSWAGGACLGGRFTAAGMDVSADGGSLSLRKSWMCFDREVVALGAGITATDDRGVETIIENRRLGNAGDEMVSVNGELSVSVLGSSATVSDARWLHIEGTGGFVFPSPVSLRILREQRTGRWSDVTRHPVWIRSDPITATYLTAWLDHGVAPSDQTYAYVLLPTATPASTRRYSAEPGVAIVANTSAVQAARALDAGVLCANFWRSGTASLVSASSGVSVVLEEGDTELAVAIADPTQRAKRVTLTVSAPATSVVSASRGLEVRRFDPLTIAVDLSDADGGTRLLRVKYLPLTVADVRARLRVLREDGVVGRGPYAQLDRHMEAVAEPVGRGQPRHAIAAVRRLLASYRDVEISTRTADKMDDYVQRLMARIRT